MALIQGEQLGRLLLQNIWKVVGAFGIGVIGVVGAGLVLSNVHGIPQSRPSAIQASHQAGKSDLGDGTDRPKQNLSEVSGGGTDRPPSLTQVSPEIDGTAPESQVPAGSGPTPALRKKVSKAPNENSKAAAPPRPALSQAPIGGAFPLTQPLPGPGALHLTSGAPGPADAALRIEAETPITVRLTQQLSTKQNHKGEVFKGALAVPLTANGIVIAPAGAAVIGRIVDARSARFFRGSSTLNLDLTEVEALNGRPLRIKTAQWYETGSHSRVVKAAILPSEAARKVISELKAEDDGLNKPERTMEPELADNNDKSEKKKSAVTLPPGSEIVFRLLEPIFVNGSLESH
ncbi:MAG: hypothetical protein ACJ74Y_00980 [Bryobacteraceae bacterium]